MNAKGNPASARLLRRGLSAVFFLLNTVAVWYVGGRAFSAVEAFDYGIAIPRIRIAQGLVGTTTMTVTRHSGIPEDVLFFTDPLPSGLHVSFDPIVCTPDCMAIVTIKAGTDVLVGDYAIVVNAINLFTDTLVFSEAQVRVTVAPPPLGISSCGASKSLLDPGEDVVWAVMVNGGANDNFEWSGHTEIAGRQGNPVHASYMSAGERTALVRVRSQDGQDTGVLPCATVRVRPKILSFNVSPTIVAAGGAAEFSWTTTGFSACALSAEETKSVLRSVPVHCGRKTCPREDIVVRPLITTLYTLSCRDPATGEEELVDRTVTVFDASKKQ